MKSPLVKLVLLNVGIAVFLLIVFYFSAFLSGYGSNSSYLPREKRLFTKFLIIHAVIATFLFYTHRQINWILILASMSVVVALYLIAAWQFGYFN